MNSKQLFQSQSQIQPSSLTANTLVNVNQGVLDATLIPAVGQPDWILPTALILAVEPADVQQTTLDNNCFDYLWRPEADHQLKQQSEQQSIDTQDKSQTIKVYALTPTLEKVDTILVLEGENNDARLGLLIQGELAQRQIKLSDIKDIEPTEAEGLNIEHSADFVFQLVSVQQQVCIVPDLTALAAHIR